MTAAIVLLSMCSGIGLQTRVNLFGVHQSDQMVEKFQVCHMYICVCIFVLSVSSLMPFCIVLYATGAENGSTSQGTAGQSGPMAGSTGGVSKAAKGQGSAEKEEQTGNQKRARRQWESWSAEDKNSFFEGLYEVRAYF